jgi:hypothetical protein
MKNPLATTTRAGLCLYVAATAALTMVTASVLAYTDTLPPPRASQAEAPGVAQPAQPS